MQICNPMSRLKGKGHFSRYNLMRQVKMDPPCYAPIVLVTFSNLEM